MGGSPEMRLIRPCPAASSGRHNPMGSWRPVGSQDTPLLPWGAGHDFGPTIGASATAAGFLLGSPFCELRRSHVQPSDFLLSSLDKSHLHPSLGCGPGYRPITGFSAPAPAGQIPSWLQMSPWLWGPARWPQPLLASCPPSPQGRNFLGHQKR